MALQSLRDLFIHELQDLYSAERQLTAALPQMVEAARCHTLRELFSNHLEETQKHVQRVQQLLRKYGAKAGSVKCVAMEGLIKEGRKVIREDAEPAVKDAALISTAQRVEHYEIAAYGTVRAYAEILGDTEAANVLDQTLEEESSANEKLNDLAVTEINQAAMGAA